MSLHTGIVLPYLTGLLTRSTYILTRPPSETVVVTPSWAQKGGGGTFSPRNFALRHNAVKILVLYLIRKDL